ncbi:DUF6519 domain-containing protein [Amycolatopsis nigrescens]|uniref:DUF6519 domain-containing protein n=1 Tax=Amycolatopsis nigrescens TaxID=381445 RepID=UPI00035C7E5E|nr:DUF6519 domain-containing protein [Amycolatopsis nigrescens]
MKGDFTRLTFRADRHYSGVWLQQGRVQLDADANEQAAIQLALTRRTAADLIGPHGGPGDAFTVKYIPRTEKKDPADLEILNGRYYVDGVLVDSARPVPSEPVGGQAPAAPGSWTYWDQPFAYLDREREADALPEKFPFLVYLVAWEQLVTALEDPSIAESALGSALPDTAARTRTAWQVRALTLGSNAGNDPSAAFAEWVRGRRAGIARLAARTERPERVEDDPCILSPDAAYRGPENQLYRVEVHHGGEAGEATVKWSRDNGSVAVGISSVDGEWVTVASLGRDDKLSLRIGDWTEVSDDAYAARGEVAPLLRVEEVDTANRRVRLSGEPRADVGHRTNRHPLLRRWDHRAVAGRGAPKLKDGAIGVEEGEWLDLEDGVQVWFKPGGRYRSGDHWLIPARTLAADVEWPQDDTGRPLLAEPHGVEQYYAPLAWVRSGTDVQLLRRTFRPLAG